MGQPWDMLGSETIEVLSGTVEEDYGTETHTNWDDPAIDETIEQCSVQPIVGTQVETNREAIITRYQVFAPGHHPLLSGVKRVRWRGTVYAIDGSTPYFPDPFGLGLDHHVFYVKEVNG